MQFIYLEWTDSAGSDGSWTDDELELAHIKSVGIKVHGSYRGRLAINSSGELWGWGQNSGGRLGDGTSTNRSSPVQIGSDTTWTTARCGGSGALALKSG